MKESLRLASIDIGTNSTRLLVADCDGNRTDTLDRRMVITRLGEDVDKTGELKGEAIGRTVSVLENYGEVMSGFEPAGVVAAATSALRDCNNGEHFLDLAEDAIGSRPLILSGDVEAEMSFVGALSDLGEGPASGDSNGGPVLVFDIGGGSTELIVGRAGSLTELSLEGSSAVKAKSIDVGCVRMSERFLKSDPPSPVAIGRMESHLIARLKPAIAALLTTTPTMGVGLAGTVTTVSAIKQGLREYDTDRIHHSRLERSEIEGIFRLLASVTLEERKAVMGLEPQRADVILGGIAVLRAVMDLAVLGEILVSEKDILDGLVINLRRQMPGS